MVTMTSKGKKKATSYQRSHTLDFALEVILTAANGDVTAMCKFCLYEGRDVVQFDDNLTCKRKHCYDIQYFMKPFNSHKYCSHHVGQHRESWEWYQTLSVEDKKQLFDAPTCGPSHQHADVLNQCSHCRDDFRRLVFSQQQVAPRIRRLVFSQQRVVPRIRR